MEVHPYAEADKEAVIDILLDALSWLMGTNYSIPQELHRDFLLESGIIPPYPAPVYYVAKENGKTIGYMYIKWNGLKGARKKSVWVLSKFGWLTFAKVLMEYFSGSDKRPDDVCYVAELAVKKGERSRGAGTALLEYGKKLAKEAGLKKYTLDVYTTNTGALRLYQKLGFKITAEYRRSWPKRVVMGERNWYSMSQDI